MDQTTDINAELIRTIVKTQTGTFVFTCELNSDQHKFIFDTGLRYLLATGAIPVSEMLKQQEGSIEAEEVSEEDKANLIVPPTLN